MTDELIPVLQQRLQNPLPGWKSQWELTSMPGRPRVAADQHRAGAVLSLLYPHEEELHMVFMKRTDDGKAHGGQISFPGGKHELYDPSLEITALREAEEELGIVQQDVQVIGGLTELYIEASNFLVQPVVGYAANRPIFRPSPVEVDEILEVSVAQLLQTPISMNSVTVGNGFTFEAKAFLVKGHIIWGATAMILNELLTAIRDTTS